MSFVSIRTSCNHISNGFFTCVFLLLLGSAASFQSGTTHDGINPAPIQPAKGLSPSALLALTIFYEASYGLLFLFILCQLWMIYFQGHKLLSYQSLFLYLNLFGSALRIVLFSFYFNDYSVTEVNSLSPWSYWLLYCFPICLEFATLVLLGNFFLMLYYKTISRTNPIPYNYKPRIKLLCLVPLWIFCTTNVTCGVVSRTYLCYSAEEAESLSITLAFIRVSINDTLFVIFGVIISFCIYRISKINAGQYVLQGKGMTICQTGIICGCIIFLYTSRALYNMAAVILRRTLPSFGYNWINITDQADFDVNFGKGFNFLQYGIVLFLWEFLPTSLVAYFFRVKLPESYRTCLCCCCCNRESASGLSSSSRTVSTTLSRSRSSGNTRSFDRYRPTIQSSQGRHTRQISNTGSINSKVSENTPLLHGSVQ